MKTQMQYIFFCHSFLFPQTLTNKKTLDLKKREKLMNSQV